MTDSAAPDILTAPQQQALAALLSEPSIRQAAKASGTSESTLHRWLRNDTAFVAAYRDARREAVQQAVARLQQASGAAVAVLLTLMATKTTADPVRLAAARTVLEMSIKAVELEDVMARLEALEAAHATNAR